MLLLNTMCVKLVTSCCNNFKEIFNMDEQDDNITHCNDSLSKSQENHMIIIRSSIAAVAVYTCMLSISLVFCLKLHKYFIYRLAVYKVVSAMLVNFIHIAFASYILQGHHSVYHVICLTIGFLFMYFLWINLLFTVIIMFHFFSLTVCLKNLKHLEVYYVVFSLLIPLVFLWIPFVFDSYGPNNGMCWIRDTNTDCTHNKVGMIEQYTLWYGPSYLILAISVLAAVIVVIVLLCRGCRNGKESDREPLLTHHTSQHKKAVIELIPLLMYPAIFLFYVIFRIVLNNQPWHSKSDYDIELIYSVVMPSWGMLSSIVLLLLIVATKCSKKKKTQCQPSKSLAVSTQYNKENEGDVVFTAATTNHDTIFSLPRESEVDNRYEYQ